jgi:hypothetical protein
VHGKHIKAAIAVGKLGMMLEKSTSCCNDFLLLGPGYAGSGPTETKAAAQTDFSEYEHVGLLHDEVDLAATTAKIGKH